MLCVVLVCSFCFSLTWLVLGWICCCVSMGLVVVRVALVCVVDLVCCVLLGFVLLCRALCFVLLWCVAIFVLRFVRSGLLCVVVLLHRCSMCGFA